MSDEKIDYVYKQMKEREERIKVVERNRKIAGKVIDAFLFIAILALFFYAGYRIATISIDMLKLIKDADLKMAVITLMTFMIGMVFLLAAWIKACGS